VLLTTELPTGPYPYAGLPWFSTIFGRDAIVTALQTLWLQPRLARGVLSFLAQHQATETSPFRDAQPGKIMHECRKGEMSATDELPFARYYGGVDTTPLFVMLAGAYAAQTGDLGFIEGLWPALRDAASWIERTCDGDADGFLTYARAAETGLDNQGWKDSHDAIFHADGSHADGPIALVEVQGYVFAARRAMAELARRLGYSQEVARWRASAAALRDAVEKRFWMEDAGFYALAIDGHGQPCRVRASNAGHLLFTGLPAPHRARRVAAHLLDPRFNSGWGIRTLSHDEVRFNPMSYHNGSIWPHDTALCAAGLARYGFRDGAMRLLSGAFEAAVHFDMRLPELFCGFRRIQGEAPIRYPVACLPQAWASGSVFMTLQACLGLQIDSERGEIRMIARDCRRASIG
jgi:glycogen debranching enzyme